MMEFIFFNLFSIIFLAKGKISKSISLTRLQDFKSNVSLEQSDEIVYFFACWCQIWELIGKYWGVCGHKWSWPLLWQGKCMNEWMNLAHFLHVNTYSGKLKVTVIVIGWAWSNTRAAFLVMGLYNLLYLKDEWRNWADFCMFIHGIRKKGKTLRMHMVKYGFDLLGPGTLKSALSQE